MVLTPTHRARRDLLVAAVVTALLAPFGVAHGQSVGGRQAELAEVQRRVDAIEDQLEAAQGDVTAARAALAAAEDDLAAVEERVNAAATAVRQQRVAVAASQARLEQLEAEAAGLASALERRAVSLYMNGSTREFDVLLTASDVQAAIDRTAWIDLVTGAGRNELEAVRAAEVAIAAEAARLADEQAELVELQEQEEELLVEVQRLRDAQAAALGDARAEVDSLASQRDDLEADAGRIEELIAQAQAEQAAQRRTVAPPPAAPSRRGDAGGSGRDDAPPPAAPDEPAPPPPSSTGYQWPLCRAVTSNFGYRWGRLHKGIDIDGNTGDPIGAAASGVVISAGYSGGYGNLTLIDHGTGVVTAYAHQSSILVSRGQRVGAGQRIGLVGNTGNSTGAHLHFETRVNGGAVDPRRYLPGGC